MTRPEQIILETLEKEIRENFRYSKPLYSNDLSEDARIARAFFVHIAMKHFNLNGNLIISYLRYGTTECIPNVLIWVNNELNNVNADWNTVIDYIKDKVNRKCNL